MKIQEFLQQLPDLVRQQLPPELQNPRVVGPFGGLLKWHYGNPKIHYEVWLQRRLGIIEIGLHFEGDADANAQHLAQLSQRFEEIRTALGPAVEPEQWTRTWTRIHQTLPLRLLEEPLALELSTLMADMIKVLEPVVRQPL